MAPTTDQTVTSVGASGLVVRGEQLLMVRQVRATGVRWEVPGGGQEAGESLEQTVVRELAEEAAIAVTAGPLVCTYTSFRLFKGSIVIGGFYLATEADDTALPVPQRSDGIVEAAFVDPEKLPEDEVGPLSFAVIQRWWPVRNAAGPVFHVELWRSATGYTLR